MPIRLFEAEVYQSEQNPRKNQLSIDQEQMLALKPWRDGAPARIARVDQDDEPEACVNLC